MKLILVKTIDLEIKAKLHDVCHVIIHLKRSAMNTFPQVESRCRT